MDKNHKSFTTLMLVFSGMAMVGYAIEAGTKIISTGVSISNAGAPGNIIKNFDMSAVRQYDLGIYLAAMSLLIAIPILKSYIWYQVITILQRFNAEAPFRADFSKSLEKINQILVTLVILCVSANMYTHWIENKIDQSLNVEYKIEEYLFMAALVFIISHIFQKGKELSVENELTI
jgi:hypothetical protein